MQSRRKVLNLEEMEKLYIINIRSFNVCQNSGVPSARQESVNQISRVKCIFFNFRATRVHSPSCTINKPSLK